MQATRESTSGHRFFTIELTADYLRRQFAQTLDGLEPAILKFLDRPEKFIPWLKIFPLPAALLAIRPQLLNPPVNKAALETWYQGKILEVLAQTLFRPDKPAELFCDRHRRVNKERVERVKYLLERDLENPPSLDMLGAEVNCSSFYLSRLFAEEMGLSIPKYLRLKRIERAADLIVNQGLSVTEAGMSVGYSSLSAFHRAFLERFGVSPGAYAQQDKR